MEKSRKILLGGLGLILVVALGAFALFTFRDSGPDRLTIGEGSTATASTVAPSDGDDETADAGDDEASAEPAPEEAESDAGTADGETSDPGDAGVDGDWSVSPQSIAGYRVVEDFASGLSDFEAVGRTSDITGALTIEGTQVTAANFSVDVASIKSDDGTRDRQFAGKIMNSDEFPTADFVLTSPIELGSIPADGQEITADAVGTLTLRGSTNDVTFPITAKLVGDEIQTLGNIDVLFSDYGIANPSNPAISVRDEGLVEFSLIFVR